MDCLSLRPAATTGRFYYRLALDPANLHHEAFGIHFDSALRLQRIFYPALAWLVSLGGRPSLVVYALVVVSLVALVVLGLVGGALARDMGRHAAWGLAFSGYFGFVFSFSRDLAEPVGAALALLGLLALRRRRWCSAGGLFAAAALTRETALLLAVGWAIFRLFTMVRDRTRPCAEEAAWLLPFAAFFTWQAVVHAVTGQTPMAADSNSNLGLPLWPWSAACTISFGDMAPSICSSSLSSPCSLSS